MNGRACKYIKSDGLPCRAPPLQDNNFCRMHSPEHADEVAESRRLGGLRRRREVAVTGAYEVGDLGSIGGIRRVLEIAFLDTLGLENSVARSRALAYLASVALKALEVGEQEHRIEALEAAVSTRPDPNLSPFDAMPEGATLS